MSESSFSCTEHHGWSAVINTCHRVALVGTRATLTLTPNALSNAPRRVSYRLSLFFMPCLMPRLECLVDRVSLCLV